MGNGPSIIESVARYDKGINAAYGSVKLGKIYKKIFDDPKYVYLYPFLDKRLFISLAIVDLVIGLKYLEVSQRLHNQLEGNYFARVVALTAHEILNDLPKLSNPRIRQTVISEVGEAGIKELDGLIKSLNGLKKSHLTELKEIRNNIIGHKLDDALLQSDMIHKLDAQKIFSIGDNIAGILTKLLGGYTTVVESLAKPMDKK